MTQDEIWPLTCWDKLRCKMWLQRFLPRTFIGQEYLLPNQKRQIGLICWHSCHQPNNGRSYRCSQRTKEQSHHSVSFDAIIKKWFNDDNVFVWKHSTRKVTSFTGFDFYSSQIWTRDTGWGERFLPLCHACPPNTGIVLKRNKRIPLLLSVRKKSKTSSNLEEAIGNPIKNRGLVELAQSCGTHGY